MRLINIIDDKITLVATIRQNYVAAIGVCGAASPNMNLNFSMCRISGGGWREFRASRSDDEKQTERDQLSLVDVSLKL